MTKTRTTLPIVIVLKYPGEQDDRKHMDFLRKKGVKHLFQVSKRVLWSRRNTWIHYLIRLPDKEDFEPPCVVTEAYPCEEGAPLSFQFDGEWYSVVKSKER